MFWPDSQEAQSRTNLRQALHLLRRALPEADRFLDANGTSVRWRADASVWLDVVAFDHLTARAEQARKAGGLGDVCPVVEEAVALYAGDLLPGCYDDWIVPERERRRAAFLRAAEWLAELLEVERDYRGAIPWARRLLDHDPDGEEGMLIHDCDLRLGLHAKRLFDAVGHYSRDDVLDGLSAAGPASAAILPFWRVSPRREPAANRAVDRVCRLYEALSPRGQLSDPCGGGLAVIAGDPVFIGADGQAELLVYEDPEEGFRGFLAYAGQAAPLAAGGFRVQKGLRGETIMALAEAMALKERVLALNVDGAKCGIDYDPASPGKHAAMRRFLRFLAPHLHSRLSLGPDMGTDFNEIEALARQEGIGSVKAAIAHAQGLPRADVLRRLELLDEPVGPLTLGQRRAGHALAQATLVALRHVAAPGRQPRCALQGFGTLGRAAALSLHDAGVLITVVADEHGSLRCDAGLDVPKMLAVPAPQPVAEHPCEGTAAQRTAPFGLPVDAVVLAACEDAMSTRDAAGLQAAAVVVGANRGLSDTVETLLHERGIVVVPDFVGGAGGSAAMDALFASPIAPDARSVLDRTAAVADVLTEGVLRRARASGTSPRQAALALARERRLPRDARPYGLRLLEPRRDDHLRPSQETAQAPA